jgi:hypothetical protein
MESKQFSLPPSSSTSITLFCGLLCLTLLISDGSCFVAVQQEETKIPIVMQEDELRSQMLPSSSSSMLPFPVCELPHEAYSLEIPEKNLIANLSMGRVSSKLSGCSMMNELQVL